MDYDSLLALVKKRRSLRRFKAEQVPDDIINKIIEVARWAPSGANTQPWEFVIIREIETKRKIAGFIDEHRVLAQKMELTRDPDRIIGPGQTDLDNPVLIILCGDPRTIQAYPLYSILQRGQSNLDSSLASAFLYMHLAATSLGLGSRWITVTRNYYVQCLTKDLLGIPDELGIYDTMAVGYPEEEVRPRFIRERENMVHYEHYDMTKFRTNEDIKTFITGLHSK